MTMTAAHSLACTSRSTFSRAAAMPESFPSHFAQNMNVAAEPNARMTMSATCPVSAKETRVAHFATSMPNGAMNMHKMPSIMNRERRGMRSKSRSMSSMSRLPMWCSAVPTHKNRSDLAMAWNRMRNAAAQTASGVPTPAQATIRPRLAMVEYASTRLALVCEMAMNEQSANVMPPTSTVMMAGTDASSPPCGAKEPAYMTGESLTSKNTPALTMVEECRSAEVGVGATMAPRSHVWKGICAAFVSPASASAVTGSATRAGFWTPICRNSISDSVPSWMAQT